MSVADPVVLCLGKADTTLYESNDDDLMAFAGAGRKEAFEHLVRRHQRAVRNVCARLCGSVCLGDDLAQEVFVAAWQFRQAYEPRGRFQSYLFKIAINRCKNHHRDRSRRPQLTQACEPLAAGHNPFDEVNSAEHRRCLNECLTKLSAEQRQVIALKYGADLDYAQIAQIVKRSEATVRSRAFLGIARLRRLIGKWGQL